MIFTKTKLEGAYIIEPEKFEDQRGFFGRIFDKNEFSQKAINSNFVQCSISFNKKKGTIRGMHYQLPPNGEDKLVICTKGKIFDVILDIRSNSNTFKQWQSVEISSDNYKMLFIPKGFAHGFQTLEDNTQLLYFISEYHNAEFGRGLRWDDEMFKIKWPQSPTVISEKDLSWKPLVNSD